ncbi:hypothetical protein FSP39_011907 [Pinctada imbricata]|uniref:Uncharacterized protein n=1 Tax=Pinctada imbricata TaxID=66713 RepID=A0AA88YUT3_PINIB|nr:hypothetical protein FSP39_011907 [Pinctada imbricata]
MDYNYFQPSWRPWNYAFPFSNTFGRFNDNGQRNCGNKERSLQKFSTSFENNGHTKKPKSNQKRDKIRLVKYYERKNSLKELPFHSLGPTAFYKIIDHSSSLRRELSETKGKINSANSTTKCLLKKVQTAEKELASSKKEIMELQSTRDDLVSTKKELSMVRQISSAKITDLETKLYMEKGAKKETAQELERTRILHETALKRVSQLLAKEKLQSDEISALNDNFSKISEDFKCSLSLNKGLQLSIGQLKQQVHGQSNEIDDLEDQLNMTQTENEQLQGELCGKDQQILHLEAVIEMRNGSIDDLYEEIERLRKFQNNGPYNQGNNGHWNNHGHGHYNQGNNVQWNNHGNGHFHFNP